MCIRDSYKTLSQSNQIYKAVATNGETGEPHYFTKDDFRPDFYEPLKASSAIPGVCLLYTSKHIVEMVELKDHPWFVASQAHPEFKSRPTKPLSLIHISTSSQAHTISRLVAEGRSPASRSLAR